MTDHSEEKGKTNKWLWPLLAALVLVAILAWAFNQGADDGDLSERMASDPVSRQPINRGEPAPPAAGVSTLVPDNADGNASVITEADAARQQAGTGAPNDGVAGTAGQAPPVATGSDARPANP
jgi:hypothetical protein